MMIAVFNNLPELTLGLAWSGLVFATGARFGRWRERRKPTL